MIRVALSIPRFSPFWTEAIQEIRNRSPLVADLRVFALAAVAALFFPFVSAQAADRHWTGATDTNWGTNGNWTPSGKPANGDIAIFDGTFSNLPNLPGNQSTGGVWMTGAVGQNVTISSTGGVLTLNSNTINGTAGLGMLVNNANAFKLTITAPLKVSDNQTWSNASANLVTIGSVDLNSRALTFNGTGNFLVNGVISNGGTADTLTITGSGTRTFTGANTYDGVTQISGGVLNIQNNTALGTTARGTTVVSGAALQMQGGITVGTEALTLNGSGVASDGALRNISGSNTYGGAITVASNSRINSDAGTLTLSNTVSLSTFTGTFGGSGNIAATGVISGTGSVAKDGTGTVTLSATNTFTGTTTVSGGTLVAANGSGSALGTTTAITVNSGGTLMLGANNQINNTAPVTLAGGTFAKGNFSEGTAATAGMGALTLTAAGSKIDFGTGTVGVTTFASFSPGAFSLTIDNWTGTINTVGNGTTDRLIFASDQSANLSKFNFTGYGPGAVEFSLGGGYYEVVPNAAVPEASTWVAASLALTVVGFHFFRRRRAQSQLRVAREVSPMGGTGVASISRKIRSGLPSRAGLRRMTN